MSARRPCFISIAGYSGAGKTSLLERLLPRLAARGLSVGYLKADAHRVDGDCPGKDSDRLRTAGAVAVAVHGRGGAVHYPGAVGPMLPTHAGPEEAFEASGRTDRRALHHSFRARLHNLTPLFRAADLVLVEGMKASQLPKLVVQRGDNPRGTLDLATLDAVLGVIELSRMPEDAGQWEGILDAAESLVLRASDSPVRRGAADLMGAVIAGGGSTRMGADKAALPIPGWPKANPGLPLPGTWLEQIFLLLLELVAEPWVIGRIVEAGSEVLPLLETQVRSHLDLRAGMGPLGGWETALSIAGGRGVLALPSDLPFIRVGVLETLVGSRDRSAGATAFERRDGRREPAVVILEPRSLPLLRSFLDAGDRKAEAFLERVGTRWIPLPADHEADLINVNTQEDRTTHRA